MSIKTIFLDRDGVINKEVNYLHKIEDFKFIEGVFDACQFYEKLKFKIIIVSNQSGISRGYFKEEEYQILSRWMLKIFKEKHINILDIFHCPHGPNSNCECRKPKPGMFFQAMEKYNIDFNKSWMIGDKETDIQAANLAGISNTILVKSGHLIEPEKSNALFIIDSIKDSIKIIK